MRRIFIAVLAICTVNAFGAPDLERQVEEAVKATVSTPDTGVAVGIIRDGKVILAKGFGYRDRAGKLPVTPQTRFAIGSVTKSFTALALKLAETEGQLRLDAPVRDSLPDFELKAPIPSAEVTGIDLLSHRVGLPRHEIVWYLTPFTSDNLFYRLRYLDPNPRPEMGFRKAFQYNNLMYMVAGRMLEKRTGKRWADYLQERIFNPLGMKHATMIATMATDPEAALPYKGEKKLAYKSIENVAPAGDIAADLHDMLAWTRFMMTKGQTADGKALLPAQAVEALWAPNIKFSMGGIQGNYGMGWFVNRLHEHRLVWHNGNIDGFSAHVSFLPEKGIGLVILTNQNGERSLMFEMQHRIYGLLLGDNGADASAESLPRSLSAEDARAIGDIALPAGVSEEPEANTSPGLPGVYLHPGYGEIQFQAAGGKMYGSYYGHTFKVSEHKDYFLLSTELAGSEVTVPGAIERKGVKLLLESSVAPISFRRVADLQ
jgi:CubicO group peptidase (beta-lactamase class C family)